MREPPPDDVPPLHGLNDDDWARLVQRAVALDDAPPHCVQAALALWQARAPAAQPRSTATAAPATGARVGLADVVTAAVRVVQAVLGFDSWRQPAMAAGLRSAGGDTRHLLFNAGGRDIDLRIRAGLGGHVLTGQILGPDESGELELQTCPTGAEGGGPAGSALPATRRAVLDELGEFRIDGVPAGSYQLTLSLGRDRIVLPALEIGEPNG
ncbi:MAG: hypothetical protein RLZZ584_1720 [Pseudomonadota bacterium]|jgi:hypothetical protein